jgi:site-specific DNA recombinase
MLSIGAYVRLSPTNEEKVCSETGSLVSHPKRLEEYVTNRNRLGKGIWGQIYDFYVDKDCSGKDTNRPELQRLLRDGARGKVNVVLVTELSRLSRNTMDFLRIWQFFQKQHIEFISLREQFDTTTAAGRMMLLNMVNFAQFEREQTIERIRANNRARAKEGLASASQKHVLGYDPHPRESSNLVPNPKEAAQVKAIFEIFLQKGTLETATEEVNRRGMRTKEYISKTGNKKGGKHFTVNSLLQILKNRVYLGEREINKKNRFKDQSTLPPSEGYEVVNARWEPILSLELFLEVKKRLAENYRFIKNNQANPKLFPYVLTGIVRCAKCGENLAGRSAKGKGGHYHYYSHRPRRREENRSACPVKRVQAEKLEKAVRSRLIELAKDEGLVQFLVEEANIRAKERSPETQQLLKATRADLVAVTAKSDALLDRLAELPKGHAAQGIYEKLEELGKRKQELQTNIRDLEAKIKRGGELIDATKVFSLLKVVGSGFSRLTSDEQRRILKEVVQQIVIHPTHLALHYFVGYTTIDDGSENNKPRNRSLAARGLSEGVLSGADYSSDELSQLIDIVELQANASLAPEIVTALYHGQNLSSNQIAKGLGCAKSTVQSALEREGISSRSRRKHATDSEANTYHAGQIPYGKKAVKGRIIDHVGEQRVIQTMKKLRAEGASFSAVAEFLNRKGMRTKQDKKWHHWTVARIFRR